MFHPEKPVLDAKKLGIPNLAERDFTPADIDIIYQFDQLAEYDGNLDTPPDHRPPPIPPEGFLEAFEKGDIFRGIFSGDNLIAFYWLEPKPTNREMYVDMIMVHPDFRDRGIGKYCLAMTDYEAAKLGCDKCGLTVDPLNGRGIHTYLKHGYFIVGYDLNHWGPTSHRLLMEKRLGGNDGTRFSSEETIISCSNDNGLLQAVADKLVGVLLVKSSDKNNRNNKIVFKKNIQNSQE